MLSIETESGKILNYPTSYKEVDTEYLTAVTKNINLADNYVIVALIYPAKLKRLLLSINPNSKHKDEVVPYITSIAKVGNNTTELGKSLKSGDNAIINPSDIMIATHIEVTGNTLTKNFFLNNADGLDTKTMSKDEVYLVDFKIVPLSAIKAVIPANSKADKHKFSVTKKD